jgi:hypothetical protein
MEVLGVTPVLRRGPQTGRHQEALHGVAPIRMAGANWAQIGSRAA